MMDCQQAVESALKELTLGFQCIQLGERLEIVTPFLHPDNDLVEVFVEELGPNRVRVTDVGETLRRLETLGMDVLASPKRRFLVTQIVSRTHVTEQHGVLQKEGTQEEVGKLLLDVVSAVQAVSDLIYSSKAYEPATFAQEVSTFLEENQIRHDPEVHITGDSGKPYRVTIKTAGLRTEREILIQAMSPAQESTVTPMVNRVLRMWFDIDTGRRKISLLNDEDYTWRTEDKVLLERVSSVQNWSHKEALIEYISTT